MKIMTNMQTKKDNSNSIGNTKKRIIGIAVTIIVLVTAVVAIIFFRLMNKPQVKLANAMLNTVYSSKKSDMNERFGTYEMGMEMLRGSSSFRLESGNDVLSVERSAADNQFLMELGGSGRYKLYANDKTSLIYVDNKAMRINYKDGLVTAMSNSPAVSLLGIDSGTVYTVGQAYENVMRFAANSFEAETVDKNFIQTTMQYFISLDGTREGSRDVSYNGHSESCRLYSVEFDSENFCNYLDECFGTHEIDTDTLYSIAEKLVPEAKDIDNTRNMVHYIKQFVNDILDGGDITLYFAINKKDELVSLYANDISEDGIDLSLIFYGEKYIAERYVLDISYEDGREISFDKDDIASGDAIGVSYSVSIRDDSSAGDSEAEIEGGVAFEFDGDDVTLSIHIGDIGLDKQAAVEDFEKDKFIDIAWSDGSMHIGCDATDIEKPDYEDSIDLFEADIFSLYGFFKKL